MCVVSILEAQLPCQPTDTHLINPTELPTPSHSIVFISSGIDM